MDTSRFGSHEDFDIEGDNRTLGETEIRNRFDFHGGPRWVLNAAAPRHAYLQINFMEFADMLDRLLPPGRSKDIALSKLEGASMWAHKAISEQIPVEDK